MSFDEIIAKVKAHPELWQSSHPFYRQRVVSARTWKEIAAELNADEITVRKRWKHLKDQYRKEQKKVSTRAIPISFWHHYNDLGFLSKDSAVYANDTIIGAAVSDTENRVHSDSDDAPLKAKRPKKIEREHKPSFVRTLPSNPDSGKLNLILNRLHAMEEVMETRLQTADEGSKNDSDYMFLLSLLPIMKRLTEIQKLQFRGKINDWLLEIVTQNEFTDRLDYKMYMQSVGEDTQPQTG